MHEKRRKIWIDKFQTKLSLYIAVYFGVYQIAVWALIVIERHIAVSLESVFGPGGSGYLITLFVVALGSLMIYDAVKLSHRLVGPLYRFRMTLKAMREDKEVSLVTLRDGDFLLEMRDELNATLKVLEERGAIKLKQAFVKGETPVVSRETAETLEVGTSS
jgi:hypothetical protein